MPTNHKRNIQIMESEVIQLEEITFIANEVLKSDGVEILCDLRSFLSDEEILQDVLGLANATAPHETSLFDQIVEHERFGMIARVLTPIMEHSDKGSTYNPGHCTYTWLYGDSINELVDKGAAWAQVIRAKEFTGT